MDLGNKAKSRTPACKHTDWSLELSAEFFRIKWVASDSGKWHLLVPGEFRGISTRGTARLPRSDFKDYILPMSDFSCYIKNVP